MSISSIKIWLKQLMYRDTIEPIHLEDSWGHNRSLTIRENNDLSSTIRQLLWIANQTWLDIAFDTCQLSYSLKDAKASDISRANKVICKVKQNKMSLTLKRINNVEKSTLLSFSDASFKSLPGGVYKKIPDITHWQPKKPLPHSLANTENNEGWGELTWAESLAH